MADTLTCTISIEKNGQQLPGFPIVRRVSVDEMVTFATERANADGVFSAPSGLTALDSVTFFYYTADQITKILFDGNSDATAPLEIAANGLVILVNPTIDSGASTNITVENDSGSTALLTGVAGGT